jgi:hypothetical protein
LAVFESLALPLPLQALPALAAPTPWQAWLNEPGETPAVVLLPFARSSKVEDFEQTVRWMLANHYFRGDMLNGYSGFFPTDHAQVRAEMLKFPTAAGIELLHQKRINYVVVYHGLADAPPSEVIASQLPLVFHDELTNVAVYALRK